MIQNRIFLTLKDETEDVKVAKDVLLSPLKLSQFIIRGLFQNANFDDLVTKLDQIKHFAAGITRASSLGTYKLAEYYPFLFSFHQFFHSSYRARQGMVLEKIVGKILEDIFQCEVAEKKKKRHK